MSEPQPQPVPAAVEQPHFEGLYPAVDQNPVATDKQSAPSFSLAALELSQHATELEVRITGHDTVGSYVVYNVHSKSNLSGEENTVPRRFSDFVWVQEQMTLGHPSIIIPPLPEKSIKARFTPGAVVEYRERELERFLHRVAANLTLSTDPKFISFLKTPALEFAQLKATKPANQVMAGFKWFGSSSEKALTSIMGKQKEADPDSWFTEKRRSIEEIERQLKVAITICTAVLTKWKDMSQVYAEYSENMKTLSQGLGDTDRALSSNCELVSKACDSIVALTKDMMVKESTHFEEAVKDWWREMIAIKELLDRRDEVLTRYRMAMARQEKVEKGKSTQEEKSEAEKATLAAKEAFEEFSSISKREIERVHFDRTADIRQLVKGFSKLNTDFHIKVGSSWKDVFLHIHEDAQKESIPPSSSFTTTTADTFAWESTHSSS